MIFAVEYERSLEESGEGGKEGLEESGEGGKEGLEESEEGGKEGPEKGSWEAEDRHSSPDCMEGRWMVVLSVLY